MRNDESIKELLRKANDIAIQLPRKLSEQLINILEDIYNELFIKDLSVSDFENEFSHLSLLERREELNKRTSAILDKIEKKFILD